MSDLNNIILNKYGANCVGYWPLNGNTNDLKNANHLSDGTAGAYVNGPDGEKAMTFNGTTQSISSASAIDLTGTQKATAIFYIYLNVYDLTNARYFMEFSANSDSTAGSFGVLNDGTAAGDPIKIRDFGDVGINQGAYTLANNGVVAGKWYCIAGTFDFTQGTIESNLYVNGRLLSADTRTNNNNTASFGNHSLFISSRNNASAFANVRMSKIALFDTALTLNQIKEITAYMRPGYSILNWMSYFDDGERKRGYRYGD